MKKKLRRYVNGFCILQEKAEKRVFFAVKFCQQLNFSYICNEFLWGQEKN